MEVNGQEWHAEVVAGRGVEWEWELFGERGT